MLTLKETNLIADRIGEIYRLEKKSENLPSNVMVSGLAALSLGRLFEHCDIPLFNFDEFVDNCTRDSVNA